MRKLKEYKKEDWDFKYRKYFCPSCRKYTLNLFNKIRKNYLCTVCYKSRNSYLTEHFINQKIKEFLFYIFKESIKQTVHNLRYFYLKYCFVGNIFPHGRKIWLIISPEELSKRLKTMVNEIYVEDLLKAAGLQ